MLELSNKNFKAAIIKVLLWKIGSTIETNEKLVCAKKEKASAKKCIPQIRILEQKIQSFK
jgi:hypothetical protein